MRTLIRARNSRAGGVGAGAGTSAPITHVRSQAAGIQGELSPGGVPAPARWARTHDAGWTYDLVRMLVSPWPSSVPAPVDLGRQRARRRPGDPRRTTSRTWTTSSPASGIRRRIRFMAKSQMFGRNASSTTSTGRRRVPVMRGAPRRGNLHHRLNRSSSAAAACSFTRRADAPAPAASASRSPASAGWRSSPGARGPGRDPRIRGCTRLEAPPPFPRSPSSTASRWPSMSSSIRPVSSSTRPPRRSSTGSRRCTALDERGRSSVIKSLRDGSRRRGCRRLDAHRALLVTLLEQLPAIRVVSRDDHCLRVMAREIGAAPARSGAR